MRTQHIDKGLATIALALAFISCSDMKEVEFFTPDERAAIMARGKCESVPGSNAFCYDGLIHEKCNGVEYIPATHICQGGSARPAKCNNESYNPLEHKCEDGILKNRCGASDEYYYISDKYNWYNPSTHFCFSDSIYSKCGGDDYDPSTHFCFSDGIYSKCGGDDYDPSTHFCYTDDKSYSKCGDDYDPSTQFCDVREGGKVYKWVKIDKQVWMAENLNYDVSGSKCYAEGVSSVSADSVAKNCAKYGRLYDWATAMAVCPSGWHLPSDAEWTTLTDYVESNSGCSNCAGTHLKSASGWNAHAIYGDGTDTYGFSALPGGVYGYSGDLFGGAGSHGYWWSSSENGSDFAHVRYMFYGLADVLRDHDAKSILLSVRCVRD